MGHRFRTSALAIILCVALTSFALGQGPVDVPRSHWAYAAVADLANRGLIKGYPPDGDILGGRTVTRYEMATIISRALERFDELIAKRADKGADAPGTVTPEQLAELRRLADEFKTELLVIGADVQKALESLSALGGRVDSARQAAESASEMAAAAIRSVGALRGELESVKRDLSTAKGSLAATTGEISKLAAQQRAHKISGYIQSRFDAIDAGRTSLFSPSGAGGTGQTPTTGGPAVGGPYYGFQVRRARLTLSGPVGGQADYKLQVDAQSGSAVSVYDASINVPNLLAKNLSWRFGMFPPPFGYELPLSSSVRESVERAFGIGNTVTDYPIFKTAVSATGGVITPGSVNGLFLNQQRDVGAAITWNFAGSGTDKPLATLAVINGEGRSAAGVRNSNDGVDLVGRIEAPLPSARLTLGLSGYYGSLAVRGGPPAGNPAAPVAFVNADKILGGMDVRWLAPWGTSLRAEWFGGVFEATPDRAQYLRGNHAQAWYVLANHPLNRKLDVVAKYDELEPITQLGKFAAGLGRHDLIRQTLSGGLLYYLDDATRFRLWYAKGLTPYDPSAVSGPLRTRLGLITGEVQLSF